MDASDAISRIVDGTIAQSRREVEAFIRQHVPNAEDIPDWHLARYQDPLRMDCVAYVLMSQAEAEALGDQYPPVEEATRRWPSITLRFRP